MADGATPAEVAAGADQESAPAKVAAGAVSVEVAADADQQSASAEVAADAEPAKNQDPEAEGAQPTDPEAPPVWLNTTMSDQPDTISVGQAPQQYEPTEAERMAQGWCDKSCVCGRDKSCVCGRDNSCVCGRGRDDPHRVRQDHDDEGYPDEFLLKAVKKDNKCKTISTIDSEHNRTMTLKYEFKGEKVWMNTKIFTTS